MIPCLSARRYDEVAGIHRKATAGSPGDLQLSSIVSVLAI
jgi:hypothetical protein